MVLKNGLPKIFNDKLAGFAKARGYEPAELEFSSSGGDEIRIAAEESAALFGGNLAFSSRFQCARSDKGWNAPSEVAKSSRIRLAGRCHDEFGTALQAAERRRVLGRGQPLQFGAQKVRAPHLSRRPRRLLSEASRQMARGPIPWRGATRCCRPECGPASGAFSGAVQQDGLSGFECGDFRGELAVFNGSNEKFECRSFRRRGNGITADNRRCAGFKFHSETGELPARKL